MFQSFVIMLREGIEAALVIALMLVVLKRTGRRDLERPVFCGLWLAVLASVGAAFLLNRLPLNEEAYEGSLYFVSAIFVISMMVWMHRKAKTLKLEIEKRVLKTITSTSDAKNLGEAWGLGAFTFLMVFREGAETVMFLSAVNLTTDAVLSFLGTVLGLVFAVVFCVLFVKGSLKLNLGRFFTVTEWVLGIFVIQLLINGYHEFSEAGIFPATQKSMALVGPIVRNNSLFIIALVALPLFVWLTGTGGKPVKGFQAAGASEERLALAAARRDKFYRNGIVGVTLFMLISIGVVYAFEAMPKKAPQPELVAAQGAVVSIPLSLLEDGKLHHFGFETKGRMVRFLGLKASDGRVRASLDACDICGTFGYIEENKNLVCLNCAAEINPLTLGTGGGCNPIPLKHDVSQTALSVPVPALEGAASQFPAASQQSGKTEIDPVCGMQVKMNEATAFETADGKTYYFCSQRCHGMFLKSRE